MPKRPVKPSLWCTSHEYQRANMVIITLLFFSSGTPARPRSSGSAPRARVRSVVSTRAHCTAVSCQLERRSRLAPRPSARPASPCVQLWCASPSARGERAGENTSHADTADTTVKNISVQIEIVLGGSVVGGFALYKTITNPHSAVRSPICESRAVAPLAPRPSHWRPARHKPGRCS